eukprot:678167-Pelagomonas_calceolata.AAC.6
MPLAAVAAAAAVPKPSCHAHVGSIVVGLPPLTWTISISACQEQALLRCQRSFQRFKQAIKLLHARATFLSRGLAPSKLGHQLWLMLSEIQRDMIRESERGGEKNGRDFKSSRAQESGEDGQDFKSARVRDGWRQGWSRFRAQEMQ